MADISRYQVKWVGCPGGDGISTFYSTLTDGAAFSAGVKAFFDGALGTGAPGHLPTGVNLVYNAFIEVIESSTGELQETLGITAPATSSGGAGGTWAAPAGACITWITGGVVGGRRVRGRTFLVPLASGAFQSNGTLDDSRKTSIQTAATTYAAGAWDPCIYHRPTTVGGTDGSSHPISAATVQDKVAMLTSRRS